MTESLGFAHFLRQTDAVGYFVIAVLFVMSVATWYLIFLKAWQLRLALGRSRRFLSHFRSTASPEAACRIVAKEVPDEPFGRLALMAWRACRHASRPQAGRAIDPASSDELLTAALTHAVAAEAAGLEEGLPVLSSVAATAPFVGLFGTVWGIYRALLGVGATGQASLDQVAGAVGEALIMTGAGLAVAIPAVLGHNALSQVIRKVIGKLEYFGHEVFVLLTTGNMDSAGIAEGETMMAARDISTGEPLDGI